MTVRRRAANVRAPSGTVTFLFTDIEGSTRRWDRNRAAMESAVRLHDRIMREAIGRHGGYVFKTIGDAFCAAFATPESAVAAALEAQRDLGCTDFTGVDGLRVRMAINTGTADERDGDYFGPTVNRVARLLALGHGGQVLLSGIAADLARENPPPEIALADLGPFALKDLEREEHVYQLVAPGLDAAFPALRASGARDAAWLVPTAMQTRYFTGRDDVLARLRAQLVDRGRAALCGLGGVGKTQTVIAYAVRFRAEYPGGVFWTNAETPSGLTRGFVEIAQTLGLADAGVADQEGTAQAALRWLEAHERWLLILDNVEERGDVRAFVPDAAAGHVLITSRESVFADLGIARALEVTCFDGDETERFLLARTGRADCGSAERNAAAELAVELGNFPLALEQAAAYIAETDATFADYLVSFRKRRVAVLEKAQRLVSRDTVAVTWSANFAAVATISPAAADVLRISAFLAPDGVPYELFYRGGGELGAAIATAVADADALAMGDLLRPLARYSLIRTDSVAHTYSLHRLVQEIVRADLLDAERATVVRQAFAALDAAFPAAEYEAWSACDRLIAHALALAAWIDMPGARSASAGRLLTRAGRYLAQHGRYNDAETVLNIAYDVCASIHGTEHTDTATVLNHLGVTYCSWGRFDEALAAHDRALAIRERVLEPGHTDIAGSLSNRANVAWKRGRYAEARDGYARAIAIWEPTLGPDSAMFAIGLNNLAATYDLEGNYADAEPLHLRSLDIRERNLGPDHPHVALSLDNLGILRWHQGRYAEAAALHGRALAIYEKAFGSEHPDVAMTLNNIGTAYGAQCRFADAQALHERALSILERRLGPEKQDVAECLDGLAYALAGQGRDADARVLHERAIAICERVLGADHQDVARGLVYLAALDCKSGRYADAERRYARARDIIEQTLGPEHPRMADPLNGLGHACKGQARPGEAEAYLRRALAIKARNFDADHPEIVALRAELDAQ